MFWGRYYSSSSTQYEHTYVWMTNWKHDPLIYFCRPHTKGQSSAAAGPWEPSLAGENSSLFSWALILLSTHEPLLSGSLTSSSQLSKGKLEGGHTQMPFSLGIKCKIVFNSKRNIDYGSWLHCERMVYSWQVLPGVCSLYTPKFKTLGWMASLKLW